MKFADCVNWQRIGYFVGFFSFTFSLILALYWPNLFDVLVKNQIQLNPLSTLYKVWVKNQVPINLEIFLFNFTNADEFERNKKLVPNFEEIGPFLFEESHEKVGISWNGFAQTVTFNQTRRWRLKHELSKDVSLKVTNVNPIASTIAYISRLWQSELQRKIANALLNAHEPLFVTASAEEWLFDGIPDKFLDMFESLKKITEIPIPYNRFGWFYDRNGSSSFDGSFTIKTGASNIDDLGMTVAWNHRNATDHYSDSCAMVRGYTGELMPPLGPGQESLPLFSSDICSYITLKYKRSLLFEGLDAYEYVGDKSLFDNGTHFPENTCFYLGESCPSGLRNVSSCRYGSPSFISFPHFYLADKSYLEKVTGMIPDEAKHKFTLIVEPKTGVPLAVEAPFQLNILVAPYTWCDEFRQISKVYVPMLWFKQTVKIPNEYLKVLKIILFMQSNERQMKKRFTGNENMKIGGRWAEERRKVYNEFLRKEFRSAKKTELKNNLIVNFNLKNSSENNIS